MFIKTSVISIGIENDLPGWFKQAEAAQEEAGDLPAAEAANIIPEEEIETPKE